MKIDPENLVLRSPSSQSACSAGFSRYHPTPALGLGRRRQLGWMPSVASRVSRARAPKRQDNAVGYLKE
jgi:hypothetical protein